MKQTCYSITLSICTSHFSSTYIWAKDTSFTTFYIFSWQICLNSKISKYKAKHKLLFCLSSCFLLAFVFTVSFQICIVSDFQSILIILTCNVASKLHYFNAICVYVWVCVGKREREIRRKLFLILVDKLNILFFCFHWLWPTETLCIISWIWLFHLLKSMPVFFFLVFFFRLALLDHF